MTLQMKTEKEEKIGRKKRNETWNGNRIQIQQSNRTMHAQESGVFELVDSVFRWW